MSGPRARALVVGRIERHRLAKFVERRHAPLVLVLRGRAILMLGAGHGPASVARYVGLSERNVRKWRSRWEACPRFEALDDLPRSGRPPRIAIATRCEVVKLACSRPSDKRTPFESVWTQQTIADALFAECGERISRSSVQRVLSAKGLRPHRVRQWLHSADPNFREKVARVCELYTRPPPRSIVLCVDANRTVSEEARPRPSNRTVSEEARPACGYLPIAWCPHSTDRLCVAACNALDARVVWVPHDDGPRVAFPDLPHMLAAISDAHRNVVSARRGAGRVARFVHQIRSLVAPGDDGEFWDLHSLPHWYARHATHGLDDVACATRLLERYEPRLAPPHDVIAEHGVGFAIDLLDETCVPTLARLLERFDPSCRALYRLDELGTPEARTVVEAYRGEQIDVGRRLVELAHAHGLEASMEPPREDGRGGSLDVGTQAFRLDYWRAQRGEPDLEQRFLTACAKRLRIT